MGEWAEVPATPSRVCPLDGASWLASFCQPVRSWSGLVLRRPIDMEKRELVRRREASLLDLRGYLFSRQCTLLLFLQRPWEVAQRALQLLHSCVQELRLLEVSRDPSPPRPQRPPPRPSEVWSRSAWPDTRPGVGLSPSRCPLDLWLPHGAHGCVSACPECQHV